MIVPLIAALLAAAPALPQDQAQAPAPTQAQTQNQPETDSQGGEVKRVRSVTLTAGQTCPRSTAEEIVVCSTLDEPYRIPKQLRDRPKQTAPSTSWAVKADRAMEDGRKVLPNSCSTIGTNGQTGCTMKMLQAWAAEQNAKKNGQQVDPED